MGAVLCISSCIALSLCSPCICICLVYLYGIQETLYRAYDNITNVFNTQPVPNQPENAAEPLNTECPICQSTPTQPIQTNCNHKFCSNCFIQWWRTRGTGAPAPCPFCRCEVTFLLIGYNQTGLDADARGILSKVHDYNRKFSRRTFTHSWTRFYTQDAVVIFNYIWHSYNLLPHDVKMAVLGYTVILILYLISPIDILPEAILGPIGLIDDGAAIAVFLRQVLVRFVNSLATQAGTNVN